jgi:predicted RNA-binding Zn ribbon-like protein
MTVHAGSLALLGGELCLDFTNTVEPRWEDQPHEFLRSYADLLAWGQHAEILTREEAQHLQRDAQACPTEAAGVLEDAIFLRETLYEIFAPIASEQPADAQALAQLNAMLSPALARLQILPQQGAFVWEWRDSDSSLDRMLWPVLCSAAELLTSGQLDRLRQCPGCGWLFVDGSRSRTRRWCDMRVCGNRAKARRHYARQRERNAADERGG